MTSSWVLGCILAFGLAEAAVLKNGVEVPSYAKVCHRNAPDFNDCFKISLQTLIPKISKNGIRELQLHSLDPLFIPELLQNFGGAGYTFKSITKDTSTHGLAKVKILNVRSDFSDKDNVNLEVDFYLPKVLIEGDYKINGVIAEFSVNGKGDFNISMNDVQGTLKINGHVITNDSEEYLRIHKVSMRPDVGHMNVHFSNLVHRNPELSQIALTFFNQFWRVIYPELLPYAEEGFDKVLRATMNQATLKIPYNQLLPP